MDADASNGGWIVDELDAAHRALALGANQDFAAENPLSHQVEQAERERLRLGASTLLLVNLREQAAAEAEFRAVDAGAALQRALADSRAVTARGSDT